MSSDAMASAPSPSGFPLNYDVQYPEKLNRWLIFVKWLLSYPVILFLNLLGTGLLPFANFFAILFRKRIPRWLFDYEVATLGFTSRFAAYAGLLRDEYPAFEAENGVHLDVEYPTDLNRWLPLVKWILVIPHLIVLILLSIGVLVVLVISWFAILFTGRFPRGLFNYVVGVNRWILRVQIYAQLLMTDDYPPFSMSP
jgi:hypothetical protein